MSRGGIVDKVMLEFEKETKLENSVVISPFGRVPGWGDASD